MGGPIVNIFDTEPVKNILEEGSHASSHSERFRAQEGVVYEMGGHARNKDP